MLVFQIFLASQALRETMRFLASTEFITAFEKATPPLEPKCHDHVPIPKRLFREA
jgi:hypothetical protein